MYTDRTVNCLVIMNIILSNGVRHQQRVYRDQTYGAGDERRYM